MILTIGTGVMLSCSQIPSYLDSLNDSVTTTTDPRLRRSTRRASTCRDDTSCVAECDRLFTQKGENDLCLSGDSDAVFDFNLMIEILDNPTEALLRTINPSSLEELLYISSRHFTEHIFYSDLSDAKAFLTWIAKERSVSRALSQSNDNLEQDNNILDGLEHLLELVAPGSSYHTSCDEIWAGVTDATIGNRDTFCEIVKDFKNQEAQNLTCEIINSIRDCNGSGNNAKCDDSDNLTC